ncbi:MAG: hypothetical protein ACJA1E_000472 [Paracoccaceae bacterium]|jgi:uncharacterized protein (TIGR02302 family)
MDPNLAKSRALKRLLYPLRLTRMGMVAERIARAFWPVWTLLLAVLAAVFLGLHEALRVEVVWIVGALFLGGLGYLVFQGYASFAWPSRADAVARLDASLPGRPIQALSDTQAVGAADAASVAVWKAHVQRMAARLDRVEAVPGNLRLAARDPFALRYVSLTAFAVAVLFGSILRVASLPDAATMPSEDALVTGPSWEGWVEPPAYTGKPSLYLNDIETASFEVPLGARISLRLYGAVGALSVVQDIAATQMPETETGTAAGDAIVTAGGSDAKSSQPSQSFEVVKAGKLAVEGPGGRTWDITLVADTAPTVALEGALAYEANGQMSQSFMASDDYGVVSGTGLFELDLGAVLRRYGLEVAPDGRAGLEIDLPMAIAGDRRNFSETIVENFSKHPWSGLPVQLSLSVLDQAGQQGKSIPEPMLLPGRRFFQPVAAALIEQRRDLLWARQNGARVAQVLRAVTYLPEEVILSSGTYLKLRAALRRLEAGVSVGLTTDVQDEVAEALWLIALDLEEGDLSDALARLRRAQDQLSEAIRNGATNEEIAQLMQQLRDAMQEYMRQLAQQQQQNPDGQQQQAQNQMEMSGDQLEQLLQRLQELMEQGRTAEAAELLEQLRQMMENMQVTQGQGQQGQNPGQQAMEGLAETLRDQQGLSDDAFRDLQEQFNPGEGQQPGEQQGQPGQQPGQGQGEGDGQGDGQGQGQAQNGPPNAGSLAQRQGQLRQELNRQSQNLPGAGSEAGDAARQSLGEAGEAMDRAQQDLDANNLSGAINNQAQALESLREGMRNLGEALAQQQQQGGQQGQAMGQGDPNMQRDPLGRDRGGNGALGTDEQLLQGDDVYRRARDLLDEIRRRSSDQERPSIELEYLRRLLERF